METLIVRILRIFSITLSLIFLAGTVTGAPAPTGQKKGPGLAGPGPGGKKPEGDTPLFITSARLDADQNAGWVLFSGNVKAVHGDSTLYADDLWVFFKTEPQSPASPAAGAATAKGGTLSQEGAPAKQETPAKAGAGASPLSDMGGEKITHIVAKGQVRFVQEDRVATGTEGVYYKDTEEVVLTGNPQLWRGENTLKGERIIFNLKNNTMQVESSPQKRVEAHLYTTAKGPVVVKGEKGVKAEKGVTKEKGKRKVEKAR